MTNKHWTLIGATYAIFAIATATMATHQESPTLLADQPHIVAQAYQSPLVCCERLHQSNPRRDLWLTIWSTRNCAPCEKQKAEIPALEKAGYNIVLRTVPAPRWVKSFPTTVVTRDSLNGERIAEWAGFKTLAEIDARLKIGTTEETEEDIDYDIFNPWTQVKTLNLVVWLSNNEECDRQYEEIAKLRKLGFSANVYMIEVDDPGRHVTQTPFVALIDNRRWARVVHIWRRFVTAEEVQTRAQ